MKTYLTIILAGLMLVSCGTPPPVVKPHPRPHPNTNAPPPFPPTFISKLEAGLLRTNYYKISLKWFPSPTASVVGYQVWLGTVSGQQTNMTAVGNVTNTVIKDLRVATYYVVITAVDASGAVSPPTAELKIPAPPTIVYTPTNLVVACNRTNVPFKLYSTTNLLVPARQWSVRMVTNSIFFPWASIPPVQFFYGLDLNTNRVPLAIWTTGIITTNYNN